MLFKKDFTQKTLNGVQMGNGTIAFQGVKLNVHSFCTDGVLIDTGARSLEKFFIPFFENLSIDQVMITHYHEDHTGCATYLQKEKKFPLYMSNEMIASCKEKADYPLYRQLFWGKRKPFHALPIANTFQSRNATWSVIETPGHAKDHLSFLNRDTGQLFTGDLYCQEKTKVVLREESIPMIIESLERVLTYEFDEVFCSHAGHLKNGRIALQRKLNYLLDLQGNILKMHKEGLSSEEIKSQLFPKKYPIMRFSQGEWDSIHIVHSVIKQHSTVC
ncbi:MBL fold metallo-hydrolase [Sutcliffiella cohnii]